jgi:hypothetical protein
VSRSFAADDFPAIRARLAELRRERYEANGDSPAGDGSSAANEPHRPAVEVASRQSNGSPELLPMQRTLLRRLKAGAA